MDVIRYAVLTLSDRAAAGVREDVSGPLVCELLGQHLEGKLVEAKVLADTQESIERELIRLADEEQCHLIVTTGGTGLAPRDVAPEATRSVIDREAPGLAEAIRAAGLAYTPRAMLSRGVCGLRGRTLILNLSGRPQAAQQQLEVVLPVLPHAIEIACGAVQDCNP